MKQNPFSTALFSIGVISLVIAVIVFIGGGSAGNAGAVTFAAALFILGAMGTIGWLLLEGMQWRPSEKPTPR